MFTSPSEYGFVDTYRAHRGLESMNRIFSRPALGSAYEPPTKEANNSADHQNNNDGDTGDGGA